MPIIIHLDGLRNLDNKGLPKLEGMVKKFPKTIFIGHGPHFWAEISSDVKRKDFTGYPKGKVKKEHWIDCFLNILTFMVTFLLVVATML